METVRSLSANLHQTTRRNISEASTLQKQGYF
jgi:hypothetical protein